MLLKTSLGTKSWQVLCIHFPAGLHHPIHRSYQTKLCILIIAYIFCTHIVIFLKFFLKCFHAVTSYNWKQWCCKPVIVKAKPLVKVLHFILKLFNRVQPCSAFVSRCCLSLLKSRSCSLISLLVAQNWYVLCINQSAIIRSHLKFNAHIKFCLRTCLNRLYLDFINPNSNRL